ncbi:S8 family peptidase [Anoxybacterium hadale]|uniref:S8 family peptidase n=1 Tax=Anoxybacterium hadale TaxID=3408580 RepID=A0ACD1AE40_9FIRM|nr:S8 family peptidase [Clostridiales bacterium]
MSKQEQDWIHSNNHKLSPDLTQLALDWYRPVHYAPGILQAYAVSSRKALRKVPVIVQVGSHEDYLTKVDSLSKYGGCKIKGKLPLINSFTVKVNAKNLETIVNNSKTSKVWFDRPVRSVLDVATPVTKAPAVWSLGTTGKGIGVAVLDTGIYPHPDLAGRLTAFQDFIGNKTTPYDDNGHGTHIAGCIASSGSLSRFLYKGTAPDANLIGVKVLDKSGGGSLSTVIQGIQWCISNKNRYGIRIINLSLGSEAVQSYQEDALCQAVENAWQKGIVVCVAAGNDGPAQGTIASPGIDPMVITVGAINDDNTMNPGEYTVADYSSRGPTVDNLVKPDVMCPGTNIISLRAPNSTLDKKYGKARVQKEYLSLSGTSMATPLCAGIIALMLEADKTLSPDEVKTRLMRKSRPLPNLAETDQGRGLVDALQSIRN